MPSSDFHKIPYPPVPAGLEPVARNITSNFVMLQHFEDKFHHALNLFVWSRFQSGKEQSHEKASMFDSWCIAGARDGVFNVYHFVKTTKAINDGMRKIPTFSTSEIRQRLGTAHSLLAKYFPRIESLRKSAAHIAEFSQTDEARKHAFTGGLENPNFTVEKGGAVSLIDCLIGDRYTATYENQVLDIEISKATLTQRSCPVAWCS